MPTDVLQLNAQLTPKIDFLITCFEIDKAEAVKANEALNLLVSKIQSTSDVLHDLKMREENEEPRGRSRLAQSLLIFIAQFEKLIEMLSKYVKKAFDKYHLLLSRLKFFRYKANLHEFIAQPGRIEDVVKSFVEMFQYFTNMTLLCKNTPKDLVKINVCNFHFLFLMDSMDNFLKIYKKELTDNPIRDKNNLTEVKKMHSQMVESAHQRCCVFHNECQKMLKLDLQMVIKKWDSLANRT